MLGSGLDALEVDLTALVMSQPRPEEDKVASRSVWPWALGALGAGLAGGAAYEMFGHPVDLGQAPAPAAPAPPAPAAPAPLAAQQPEAHVPAAPLATAAPAEPAQDFPTRLTGLPPVHSQHAADIVDQYALRDDRLKRVLVDHLTANPSRDWREADLATFDPVVAKNAPWFIYDPVSKFHEAAGPMFKALEQASPAEEQDAFRLMQQHRQGLR